MSLSIKSSDSTAAVPLVARTNQETVATARRRVNIAIAILEDGIYDLLTTNDVVSILSLALGDLDKVEDAFDKTCGASLNTPFTTETMEKNHG